MPSSVEELRGREYVGQQDIDALHHLTAETLYAKLDSSCAAERTAATRTLLSLSHDDPEQLVDRLLERLQVEKKLYTKMELSDALGRLGSMAVQKMVAYLGMIGTNQYRQIPDRPSRKKSYSLLLEVLEGNDRTKISEAIDAIGYLVFYHPQLYTEDNFIKIQM